MPGTQLGKETEAINLLQPMRTPDRPRLLAEPLRPSSALGRPGPYSPSSSHNRPASARPRRRMDSSPHVPWSDRGPAPILTLPVLPEVYKRMYLGLPSHEYGRPRASPTRHDQPVKSEEWVELERQVSSVRSQGSRALVNREWSSASAFLVEALQLEAKLDVVAGLVKPVVAAAPVPTKLRRVRHAGTQTSLVFGSGIAAPEIWPDSSVRLHFEADAADEAGGGSAGGGGGGGGGGGASDGEAAAAPALVDAGADAGGGSGFGDDASSPKAPRMRSVACWTSRADHMHLEEGHQLTISLEHCVARRDGRGSRMSLRGSTEKYVSMRDALLEQIRVAFEDVQSQLTCAVNPSPLPPVLCAPLHRLQIDPYDGVTGGPPPRLGAFEVGYTLSAADGAEMLGGERVFSKMMRGCFPRAERVVQRLLRHVQDDMWRAIDFSEQEAAALLAREEQERREAEEAARMAQLHAEEEAAVAERVRAVEAELKAAHEAGIQAMGLVPTLTAKLSKLRTKARLGPPAHQRH